MVNPVNNGELQLPKREKRLFLSHAHVDRAFVDDLHAWFVDVAGVPVWYDAVDLRRGIEVTEGLALGVRQSRGMLVVVSKAAIQRGWVKLEYNVALAHRSRHPDFRVIPLVIDDCPIPEFLQPFPSIDCSSGVLAAPHVAALLAAICDYPDDPQVAASDIYVSRTWREDESPLADLTCRELDRENLRMIGDAQDGDGAGMDQRVGAILSTCRGFVAVLPHRGGGHTSEYVLREIEASDRLGLPSLLIADPRVERLPEGLSRRVLSIDPIGSAADLQQLRWAVSALAESRGKRPLRHSFVDFSALRPQHSSAVGMIEGLLRKVTSMPCETRNGGSSGPAPADALRKIQEAFAVFVDVTDHHPDALVAAGMAFGAGRDLHLFARAGATPASLPALLGDRALDSWSSEREILGACIGAPISIDGA